LGNAQRKNTRNPTISFPSLGQGERRSVPLINLKIMVSDRHLGMPMTVTSDKGGEVGLLISLVTTMRYEKLQICYLLFVLILYKGITSSRFYQRAIFPHSKPLKAHITSLVNVDGDQFGRKNSETLPMSIKQERLRQATSRATPFICAFICFIEPIIFIDTIIPAVQFPRGSGVNLFKRNLTTFSTRIKSIGFENNEAFSYQVVLVELISTPKGNSMAIESRIVSSRSTKRLLESFFKNTISPSFLCLGHQRTLCYVEISTMQSAAQAYIHVLAGRFS